MGRVRPNPPPFPNPTRGRCGKGAERVMAVTSFQGKSSFEDGLGSSPLGIAKHTRA